MKPCFCCGKKPIRLSMDYNIVFPDSMATSIQCPRCGTRTKWHRTDEDAVAEWEKINTTCSDCPDGIYIGEGDFVCDRHIAEPDKALVVEEWQPTENYLQCLREENNGK